MKKHKIDKTKVLITASIKMTGQIHAGTVPLTAILYQIAIMIVICTAVTCSSFSDLYFGYKTLYDKNTMIINI